MSLSTKSWETAYKKNINTLIGVCFRYVRDRALAEDLAHDAFMLAYERIDTYKGKGKFEGWLRRICVNTALQYIRKKNASLVFEDISNYNAEADYMNWDNELNSSEKSIFNYDFSQEEILLALNSLPDHHRLVFNLYVIDNYSHKQIAEELGITVNTSKSHLNRARKKLQILLSSKAEADSKNKKRKRAIIWFIWPGTQPRIDKLFIENLRQLKIEPTKDFINFNLLNNSSGSFSNSFIFTSKTRIATFIASVTIISIVTFYNLFSPKENCKMEEVVFITDNTDELIVDDSLLLIDIEKPVIIMRRNIKKNTIAIRKPVIVKDTTHAHQ